MLTTNICSSISWLFSQMDPVQKAVINHTFGVPLIKTKRPVISCNVCQIRFNSEVQNMCGVPSLPTGNMLDLAIFALTLFSYCTFFPLRLWNVMEDHIPFSQFGTQRMLLLGAVFWVFWPLWNLAASSNEKNKVSLEFASLFRFLWNSFAFTHSKTVKLNNVPLRPSSYTPATLSNSPDKYLTLFLTHLTILEFCLTLQGTYSTSSMYYEYTFDKCPR